MLKCFISGTFPLYSYTTKKKDIIRNKLSCKLTVVGSLGVASFLGCCEPGNETSLGVVYTRRSTVWDHVALKIKCSVQRPELVCYHSSKMTIAVSCCTICVHVLSSTGTIKRSVSASLIG